MTNRVVGPWKNLKILCAWKFFSLHRVSSRFEHGSVIVHNIVAYHIGFECCPSKYDQVKKLVLTNRLLCWVLSTTDQDFLASQFSCHPHTVDTTPQKCCENKVKIYVKKRLREKSGMNWYSITTRRIRTLLWKTGTESSMTHANDDGDNNTTSSLA